MERRIKLAQSKEIATLSQEDQHTQPVKVLVIGLGQLGLPVAKYIKQRGFEVWGYDVSPKAIERARTAASIRSTTEFAGFDVYVICVSTHKHEDMFSPQIDGILSIVEDKISNEAKSGALVSIESTIPRGASQRIFDMLNHRLHVAHVPHRWYALEEHAHGVNQLRVAGGVKSCCLDAASHFYHGKKGHNTLDNTDSLSRRSLGIPLHLVKEIEVAEITKIAENAHRYLQIAFAEDLYLYCQSNNINFAELRESLNTKWNVNILEPREGIGGHCLPKDTKMFIESSRRVKSKILSAAMEVDQDYRRFARVGESILLSPQKIAYS